MDIIQAIIIGLIQGLTEFLPIPICLPSIARIGVTSAAVPVKNTSSAKYNLSLAMISSASAKWFFVPVASAS